MATTTDRPLVIAIFGASGETGRATTRAALGRGHRVRALHHHLPQDALEDDALSHVEADVLEGGLAGHLDGVDAVISCLGVGNDPQTLLDPPPIYTTGIRNICDAMEEAEVRRLVAVSASFVESRNRGPLWFKIPAMAALHLVFEQMAQMESILRQRAGHIDWTAARPGWLMKGAPTDDYVVQADVIPPDLIRTRHADLADFMVRILETDDWLYATPAIARAEPPEASSPAAVVQEIIGG